MTMQRITQPSRWALCLLSLSASALASATACLSEGGEEADAAQGDKNGGAQTPWREQVGRLSSGDDACSGTLIARDIVLTAAHCQNVAYQFDIQRNDGTVISRTAKLLVIHPLYDQTILGTNQTYDNLRFDLMLVLLDRPINEVKPLVLDDETPVEGRAVELVGYGVTAPGRNDDGTRRMQDSYVSYTIPATGYEGIFLTAKARDAATVGCFGDSGGAMLVWKSGVLTLTGVISHGPVDCSFSNSVSVAHYSAWIAEAKNVLYSAGS